MTVIKTKKELKSYLSLLDDRKKLGLVPTMGALHKGHLALVKRAFVENDVVVVSIFVNPTQFNNPDDLKKYPKTLKEDTKLLKQVSDQIIIFAPSVTEIYNKDVRSKTFDFDGLDKMMEGAFRENHFNGVGTIVETLLRLIGPDNAYFGEKDFQQLQVIRKLVEKNNIPVNIVGCPIIREPSGLALSSRNEQLSATLRQEAAFIYKTLKNLEIRFGTESAKKVSDWATEQFRNHPYLKLEYITIAESNTLKPVIRKQKNKKYRVFVAVYADKVRLIDNIALN